MTDYKSHAKAEFEELLPACGEQKAVAAVAARYWVATATLRVWLGLPPDKKRQDAGAAAVRN
jgi:hypothetical protein